MAGGCTVIYINLRGVSHLILPPGAVCGSQGGVESPACGAQLILDVCDERLFSGRAVGAALGEEGGQIEGLELLSLISEGEGRG